jgi:hypothetical protein
MEKYYYNQDDYSADSRESVNGAFMPLKPTSSMDGLDFADEYDNFNYNRKENYLNAVDPITAGIEAGGKAVEALGKGAEAIGKIATAKQERLTAETKLAELGGKRSAQLRECENNKAFKKFADPKYRRNRIADCQKEVNKRLDIEEKEQRDIIRKSLEIEEGKVQSQRSKSATIEQESKTKKYVIIAIGILAVVYFGSKMIKKK